MPNLQSWIEEQLKKGYSKDELKTVLSKKNYPKHVISEVDKVTLNPKKSGGNGYNNNSNKRNSILLFIILLVVGIGLFIYFSNSNSAQIIPKKDTQEPLVGFLTLAEVLEKSLNPIYLPTSNLDFIDFYDEEHEIQLKVTSWLAEDRRIELDINIREDSGNIETDNIIESFKLVSKRFIDTDNPDKSIYSKEFQSVYKFSTDLECIKMDEKIKVCNSFEIDEFGNERDFSVVTGLDLVDELLGDRLIITQLCHVSADSELLGTDFCK